MYAAAAGLVFAAAWGIVLHACLLGPIHAGSASVSEDAFCSDALVLSGHSTTAALAAACLSSSLVA